MPKVSVIIPVYNAENYLRQCLDSIVGSQLSEMEIIAVDDGSSDNSRGLLDEYSKTHGVKVILQQNAGPAAARNRGLEAASGEYVGFVDSDDWVEPTMFSEMYNVAVKNDADIVFCNVLRNENQRMRKYIDSGIYDEFGMRKNIYPLLISNLDENNGKSTLRGCVWLRIFRRKMLMDNVVKFDENLIYNEDGLFCISATLNSKKYVYLGDSYLYHNRYVTGSLTKRYVPNLWNRQSNMLRRLEELTHNLSFDFSQQISKKAFEIAIYCIENICKRDNRDSFKIKLEEIAEIISSEEIKYHLKSLNIHRLKKINKLYLLGFKIKSPIATMLVAKYRMKKNKML